MRRGPSDAPPARGMPLILRVVLPRTIESSTTPRPVPPTISGTRVNFLRTPGFRSSLPGWMNLRARQRVELHPQAVLAQLLARLDERARHVAVLDEPVVLGHPRRRGVADRRRVARVRHGDHKIGLDRRLAPEDLAHAPARDLRALAL